MFDQAGEKQPLALTPVGCFRLGAHASVSWACAAWGGVCQDTHLVSHRFNLFLSDESGRLDTPAQNQVALKYTTHGGQK